MWRFLWLCRHHHHESIDEMQPAHTLGKHCWLLFCKVLHFPLTASRIREEVWNHYNQQLKKKGRKTEFTHFLMATKWLREQVQDPCALLQKVTRLKRIRLCCQDAEEPSQRTWKVTPRHMVRAWTSSQSMKSDIKWGLPSGINTKAPDWHMSVGHLEKVGQKSKLIS